MKKRLLLTPVKTPPRKPYVDELMIPQLQELRQEHGVDGYWIDGECWATCQDYCGLARKAFRALPGICKLPPAGGRRAAGIASSCGQARPLSLPLFFDLLCSDPH